MKVFCDEGVANHISPEPCVSVREGVGEASVGKMCKPAIVPRKCGIDWDADGEAGPEGNTTWRAIASAKFDPTWSENLACTEVSCLGTGRGHNRPAELAHIGKANVP